MLGLLGNVAEVKALRPQLLTPQFISVFRYHNTCTCTCRAPCALLSQAVCVLQ